MSAKTEVQKMADHEAHLAKLGDRVYRGVPYAFVAIEDRIKNAERAKQIEQWALANLPDQLTVEFDEGRPIFARGLGDALKIGNAWCEEGEENAPIDQGALDDMGAVLRMFQTTHRLILNLLTDAGYPHKWHLEIPDKVTGHQIYTVVHTMLMDRRNYGGVSLKTLLLHLWGIQYCPSVESVYRRTGRPTVWFNGEEVGRLFSSRSGHYGLEMRGWYWRGGEPNRVSGSVATRVDSVSQGMQLANELLFSNTPA